MNLTQEPEYIHWPETYYVFVEKVGPFMQNAPVAWGEAHKLAPALLEHNKIVGYMSLYKMTTSTYRAGFALEAPPSELPKGLSYEKFEGGRYAKFVLTGPYSQLGPATGRVMEMVKVLRAIVARALCNVRLAPFSRRSPPQSLRYLLPCG